jgi:hypothetical protein
MGRGGLERLEWQLRAEVLPYLPLCLDKFGIFFVLCSLQTLGLYSHLIGASFYSHEI